MTGAPAPEAVLTLFSCDCTKAQDSPKCGCFENSLKCIPACKNKNCNNMNSPGESENESLTQDFKDSSDDSSSDGDSGSDSANQIRNFFVQICLYEDVYIKYSY